jgi:hypothetical protein
MYICVGVSILPLLDPTQVVSTKATHEKVYKIQHYEIKFVRDLWQVCGFFEVL